MSATAWPVNPLTGLYNVTPAEVADARAATEDVPLVREDGTLTPAGQVYVSDQRHALHDALDEAIWDANPHRFEGEL